MVQIHQLCRIAAAMTLFFLAAGSGLSAKGGSAGLELLGGEGRAFSGGFAGIAGENYGRFNLLQNNLASDEARRNLGILDHLNYKSPAARSRGGRASIVFRLSTFLGFGFSIAGSEVRLANIPGPDANRDLLFLYLIQTEHWSAAPNLVDALLLRRRRETVANTLDWTGDLYLGYLHADRGNVYLRLSLGLASNRLPQRYGMTGAALGIRTPDLGRFYLVLEAYAHCLKSISNFTFLGGNALNIRDSGAYAGIGFKL